MMPTKTKQTKNCTKIKIKKFREKNVSARYVKPCVNFIAGTQNTICNVQRIFEKEKINKQLQKVVRPLNS